MWAVCRYLISLPPEGREAEFERTVDRLAADDEMRELLTQVLDEKLAESVLKSPPELADFEMSADTRRLVEEAEWEMVEQEYLLDRCDADDNSSR